MARFKYDEVDHYGGQGGAGYFRLKDDGDIARVRFMYDSIEDVEGFAVHEIEIDGRKRYVNCLRNYNDPIDACPFCREHKAQQAKLFIPLYNIDEDKVQIWERGKKYFQKMSSLCARYNNLVSHTFEIERNGRAGDQKTTYEVYEVGKDATTLEDLPETPDVLGGIVLDKTAEDMEVYLETGSFPPADGGDAMPIHRRPDKAQDSRNTYTRRTPANSRNREDF